MARKVRQYNEENDAAEREDSFKQDMEMWLEQDKEKNRFGEWLRRLDSVDSVREWASRAKRETKQRLNTGVLQEILNIKEKILSLEVCNLIQVTQSHSWLLPSARSMVRWTVLREQLHS